MWLLRLLKGLGFLGSIICISVICHLSRNDPFEKHIIQILSNYFNDVSNITNLTETIEKDCKSNDEDLCKYEKEVQIKEENKKNF